VDIFFKDPGEIPLPPDEVRIKSIRSEVGPDNRKIKVMIEVDPFQVRPNFEITILEPEENVILASTTIIESIFKDIEATLHIRSENVPHKLEVRVELYYIQEQYRDAQQQSENYDPDFNTLPIDKKEILVFMN
jgi:hypothetical protein